MELISQKLITFVAMIIQSFNFKVNDVNNSSTTTADTNETTKDSFEKFTNNSVNNFNQQALIDATHKLLFLFASIQKDATQVTSSNSLHLASGKQLFTIIENILSISDTILNLIYELSTQYPDLALNINVVLTDLKTLLSASKMHFNKCHSIVSQKERGGTFEWVDGIVVQALEKGHWLFVDNINLCSSAVLDRLNSLLEPGGSILLTECGGGNAESSTGTSSETARSITPHPDFRIFFSMVSKYINIAL
jgi:midasin